MRWKESLKALEGNATAPTGVCMEMIVTSECCGME